MIRRRAQLWTASAAATWLLLALCAGPILAAPGEDLRSASRAYQRSDFTEVVRLLSPLLSPTIRFSDPDQTIEAHRLLALSHLFERDRVAAERTFMALLAQRPNYQLDPLVDPVAAVEFFEDVKKRNAEKIKKILRKERLAQERQRLAEQRQKAAERKRQKELRTCKNRQLEVEIHPLWINFVPFGAGQFQNGHSTKGFVVLGLEAAFGALSLGTALGLRFAYPDSQVPSAEYDQARALAVTQVVAGALFFATVAYGVVDGLVYHRPRVTRVVTKPPEKKAALPFFVVPTVTPQGAGLGARMTF